MNHRWTLYLLLIFSISTFVFELGGGYAQTFQSMHTTTPPHPGFIIPHPMALLAGIGSLACAILGVILTARAKQWKWMLAIILTSYIGSLIYVITIGIQAFRQPSKEQDPALLASES